MADDQEDVRTACFEDQMGNADLYPLASHTSRLRRRKNAGNSSLLGIRNTRRSARSMQRRLKRSSMQLANHTTSRRTSTALTTQSMAKRPCQRRGKSGTTTRISSNSGMPMSGTTVSKRSFKFCLMISCLSVNVLPGGRKHVTARYHNGGFHSATTQMMYD